MSISRFLIHIKPVDDGRWQVTFESPDQPGWQKAHALLKTAAGPFHFPRPDPAARTDLPSAADDHYALCLGDDEGVLLSTYRQIVDRSPQGNAVKRFGRYLFDTLIGHDVWTEMLAAATAAGSEMIELALAWPAGETDLHRLNWEMMHDRYNFLAAKRPSAPREVAITRIVAETAFPPRATEQVPRALFVIGTDLTDPAIRPGAEYLGLLRQIERSGRTIHTRVLRKASPERLKQTIRTFRPDIVHFICHGDFDDFGEGYLELALDKEEQQEGEKQRKSQQLFQFLSAGDTLPAVVVLSACNTGQTGLVQMLGAHKTAPLAASLVSLGIPVVVGMAGRVADSACRHFTRRFGEAIVGGESLVKATAEGRRAAFAHDQSPEQVVDWAFPAVFMSTAVAADYTPTPATDDDAPPVEAWIRSYDARRDPIFCGRLEFFDAYYDLFDPNKSSQPQVLAAYGDSGLGKTRLLKELTAQAVRDGHLPIMISSDSENWEPPRTLDAFRIKLINAINDTRRILNLKAQSGQLQLLREPVRTDEPRLSEEVLLEWDTNQAVTARVLQVALQIDLANLRDQAHDEYDFIREANGRPLLILDEVQQYDHRLLTDWFHEGVLGEFGLGADGNNPIPVIMAFSLKGAARDIFDTVLQKELAYPWLRALPLLPFPAEDDQDMLAYETVLLNPFDLQGKILHDVSNKPFAINHQSQEAKKSAWENWCRNIRQVIRGEPQSLTSPVFYTLAGWGRDIGTLIEADDEVRLEAYMLENDEPDE